MHMFTVATLYGQSIKLLHQKLWYKLIGPLRHYLFIYTKALLGKNYLSSHSCRFVKKHFFEPNSFMHMFNMSTLYRQSIKLLHQKLWYKLIGPLRHSLCIIAYTKAILWKNCLLSSHSCYFVIFFNPTP